MRKASRLAALFALGAIATLALPAVAGAAGPTATAAKKCKKKKAASAKKKKCKKTVTPAPGPPAATTTLSISPASFSFPDTQHGTQSDPQPFTVTNTGGAASGIPAASITETNNPIPGDPPGFAVSANTCTAALPPAGTCVVSVRFQPTSNATPQPYTAVLHVAVSGSDAQSSLSGTGN
jgi:hypothetical protein